MIDLSQKNAVHALPMSPQGFSLGRPAKPAVLGAPEAAFIRVVVTDVNGRPARGVPVSVAPEGGGDGATGITDSHGIFDAAPPSATMVRVTAKVGEYWVSRSIRDSEALLSPVYIQIPVCLPQPFLTIAELIALAAASGLTGAGYYWKTETLKVTGEVLFGAVVFTALYRHSCL